MIWNQEKIPELAFVHKEDKEKYEHQIPYIFHEKQPPKGFEKFMREIKKEKDSWKAAKDNKEDKKEEEKKEDKKEETESEEESHSKNKKEEESTEKESKGQSFMNQMMSPDNYPKFAAGLLALAALYYLST